MISYLLKSTSCLALLLFFYHIILEREKMHNFNRFYLLGSILFSFLVPLTTITVANTAKIIEATQNFHQLTIAQNNTPILVENSFSYTQLLVVVYLIISTLFLFRFCINLYKITQKISSNNKIKYQKAILVLVNDEILPHTFWNYIFINKKEYLNGKIEEELFTHELTHVTQRHTLDVIIIELLQILFWVNPLFIFLKKAIQLNHEFLADEKVINQHKNTFQYQHLLLNKAAWRNEYYLASNLNYSLTKKRLKMMTTKSSYTKILLKKLAVIPLITGFVLLFAERIEAQENDPKKKSTVTITKNDGEQYRDFTYQNAKLTYTNENGKKITKKFSELTREEKQKFLPPPPPPMVAKRNTPSKKLIEDLKNSKKYALWIDGKVVNNKVLNNYKNSDFSNFFVSLVHKNARSKRFPQKYQATLNTREYFDYLQKKKIARFNKWKKGKNMLPPPPPTSKVIKKGEKSVIPPPPPKKTIAENVIIEEVNEIETIREIEKVHESSNNALIEVIEETPNIHSAPGEIEIIEEISNIERVAQKNEEKPKTGWINIKGKTYYFVKYKTKTNYYNRWGQRVNKDGKIINGERTKSNNVIKGQNISKVYKDDKVVVEFQNTNLSNIPPPPPPMSPLEFIKKHKGKNVSYLYNNKKINYRKAIKLLKKNQSLNIDARKIDGKHVIKISQEPITIDKISSLTNEQIIKLSKNKDVKATYYLDGKVITKNKFDKINQENVKTIYVKKNKDGSNSIYITSK
ncbi:M56 family metallopeptidase [Tenacibaculum halocynthiae]|uniref:M56 family metallopeptidase n=1 Tax=Tenacibaculum halocynthiae TaxID=1254437 RepID=UPI003895CE0E